MTTLTAATLFLHPHCQVLNHAGGRIFGNDQVDFLSSYSRRRLDMFIRFAIAISTSGGRGDIGGSIVHSHAFDNSHDTMKELHAKSGGALVKTEIRALFWKESLITANVIRDRDVDLGAIFAQDKRLRFLLPVRHPLDCAVSIIKTGHTTTFRHLNEGASVQEVAHAVIDEFFWFAELQKRWPDRFFHYFEHDINLDMLKRLAAFMELEPRTEWLDSALAAMTTKPGYLHEPSLLDFFRTYVSQYADRYPEMTSGLLHFVTPAPHDEPTGPPSA